MATLNESLQQLLTTVRSESNPPGCTNIPSLDAHIFHAGSYRSSPLSSLNRKDVIEIQGPSIGKSHLLMHFIITCITPHQYLSVHMGGWDKAAFVLDTDHTFDLYRFRQLLVSRVTRILARLSLHTGVIDKFIVTLLQKIHIFRPKTSFQLAFTLMNMTNYHSNIGDTEVGLVTIDSASSWYWEDRLYTEQLASRSGFEHGLMALEDFRQSHGPVIILTNWGLSYISRHSPFYKQHLPILSPNNPDSRSHKSATVLTPIHHITLRSSTLQKDLSAVDPGNTNQNQEVEALVRTAGFDASVGKFSFRITCDDILMNTEQVDE